ncbi:MAG: hypothetical protein AB8E15_08575 [Bdellovibrionales bacterium]
MLGTLYKKIKIYKKLLSFVLVLFIFSLGTGIALSIDYFNYPVDSVKKSEFESKQSLKAISYLNYENWDKEELFEMNKDLQSLFPNYNYPLTSKQINSMKPELLKSINKKLYDEIANLQFVRENYQNTQKQLIWIAAFSLVFGFLLPTLISSLIAKTGWMIKKRSEKKVKDYIVNWNTEKSKHSEPFKSPEFWSKVVLISTEQFGSEFGHPMGGYAAKISSEILEEMKKQKEPTSPESSTDSEAA